MGNTIHGLASLVVIQEDKILTIVCGFVNGHTDAEAIKKSMKTLFTGTQPICRHHGFGDIPATDHHTGNGAVSFLEGNIGYVHEPATGLREWKPGLIGDGFTTKTFVEIIFDFLMENLGPMNFGNAVAHDFFPGFSEGHQIGLVDFAVGVICIDE